MTSQCQFHRDTIARDPKAMLTGIRRGLEKEGLRVDSDSGMLAQTPHPRALGSALTHPSITTDYSESLLEFITPVSDSIDASLAALDQLHRFTASVLDGELVWGASMPCIVAGESGIPIAHYGSSNVGTMKRVYRNGLGVRYGRMMQAIAGIHYNFSMPDAFWESAWELAGQPGALQAFKTEGYLGLIRNFFSRVWLLIYLLGASPAVCASFLAGRPGHPLVPFDDTGSSLWLSGATSLRMGDLGYNSSAQSGMNICYNALENYLRTLHQAIVTPHPEYGAFTRTPEGERAQLNDSLLQIENEFYSPIRPKRVTRSGEAPLVALKRDGIEYIEVRCVDINPFLPLGIDACTIRLIDTFLLACLTDDSPLCDDRTRSRDAENLARVVNSGRDPGALLLDGSGETPLAELGHRLVDQLELAAAELDLAHGGSDYARAIQLARARLDDPEQTPSGRVVQEMRAGNLPFWQLALDYSRRWQADFRDRGISESEAAAYAQAAVKSLADQAELEASDSVSFDRYLADFYRQYEEIPL